MTLKASIVGMQVKQIKNALQYLAKIGESPEPSQSMASRVNTHFPVGCAQLKFILSCVTGSELLIEALPDKVQSAHHPLGYITSDTSVICCLACCLLVICFEPNLHRCLSRSSFGA